MMIPIVLSRQLRRALAAVRVKKLGGEEVLIPVVKFIQSTREPLIQKFWGWNRSKEREQERETQGCGMVLGVYREFMWWEGRRETRKGKEKGGPTAGPARQTKKEFKITHGGHVHIGCETTFR